jgi:hypothetical protein
VAANPKDKIASEQSPAKNAPSSPPAVINLPDARETPAQQNAQSDTSSEERRRKIAEAAYYRAERRGFEAGYEDDDWLEAEKENDRR